MFTVFKMVLTMLFYMAAGFCLVKWKKAASSHAKTLSGILIYLCGPAMIVSAFQSMTYTPQGAVKLGLFFLMSVVTESLFAALLYALFRKKISDSRYRILMIGAIMGNAGFFGLPLITALFPAEELVGGYSSIYLMGMNLLAFTLGVFMLTGEKKYMSLRSAVVNPTVLTILAALPLYFLDIRLPQEVLDIAGLLGKMTTPLCMILLGLRLASVELKKLFMRPFAYGACALKLIAFPLFSYACVCWIPGLDEVFKACTLVLSAVPSAAVILSLAELHECQQELTANVVLLTTILSILTMPLLMLVL